ncbi:MAG: glycosyltransferase family 9 protein [Actinomycetota bacterium]|nr:glycosyltransferase family 9 protein [Actinomycetota bacterium]
MRAGPGPLAGVRKIAVLRANAIGDFVVSLPAFEALRAAYPEAEIVLLGTRIHDELLAGRPAPIDRVVVVPAVPGVAAPCDASAAELDGFFGRMRREQFDLAIQLHGGGRHSNPLVRRLGARTTVGLRDRDAPPLDRAVRYVYWQHEAVRFLEVVALAGARPVTIEPRLEVTARDGVEADTVVGGAEEPFVVLHAGAGDVRRRWPVAKFAAVGDELSRAGATVVAVGSGDDEALVGELASAMEEPLVNAAGRLTLGGLLGLLARSALLVGNDSGPRHLAEAVGTATVAVYWCGNLFNSGPLTRTRHRPLPAWTVACPVCGASAVDPDEPRCEHEVSFVADVSVESVLDAAVELLAERERSDVVPAPPTARGERGSLAHRVR